MFCKILTRSTRAGALFQAKRCAEIRKSPCSTHAPAGRGHLYKLSAAGITFGALIGTGYSIRQLNKPQTHIMNEQNVIPILTEVPKIQPTKKVQVTGDQSGLKLTLYQYQTCPFCCKVRAFLDYHGISYDIVEVDPVLRQATKWSPYKKVPILLAEINDGHQPLHDSTMIISALASFLHDNQDLTDIVKNYPMIRYVDESGNAKSEIMNRYFLMFQEKELKGRLMDDINEERKWRKWADDVLVHDLSPNVYRSTKEALQAFNWFSEVGEWDKNFPAWERYLIVYVGAFAMYLIGKRLKKRHNLKEDVRESLYDHCKQWVKAVKAKGGDFMGGKQPNLADLAVYGVLSSIEGCDAFKDLLRHTKITHWYLSVKNEVQAHKGSEFA